jgi:hypothetical protein
MTYSDPRVQNKFARSTVFKMDEKNISNQLELLRDNKKK